MSVQFLVNKLPSNLSLISGRLFITSGASIQISQAETEHSDVVDAVRRGWASIEGSPSTSSIPEIKIEFQKSPLEGSLVPPGREAVTEPEAEQEVVQEPSTEPAKRGRKASA